MRYVAKIKVAGKTVHLGCFSRKSEADIVFKAAAKVGRANTNEHDCVDRHEAQNTGRALIDRAGERDAWRFVEFFTVNIRNKNTRAAYGQAAGAFLRWCEGRGVMRIRIEERAAGACGRLYRAIAGPAQSADR
jgi:hypothetical protein